jgi:hypothetical protein
VLILFDHGTPKGLARVLSGHTVYTAQSKGWETLRTCRYAASLSSSWSLVRQHAERIAAAVASATPGSYAEVEIPFEPK